MESKPVAIDLGSLILVASMVVFLALAIVGETIALVFEGRPHRLLAAHPGTAIIPAWGDFRVEYTTRKALHRNGDSLLGVITNTRIGGQMVRTILMAAVALASVSVGPRHTEAYEAPWCAVISTGEDSVYWDCQYRSFEECRPNVLAGNRGWCNPSPYYVAPSAEHKQPRKRRARPQ